MLFRRKLKIYKIFLSALILSVHCKWFALLASNIMQKFLNFATFFINDSYYHSNICHVNNNEAVSYCNEKTLFLLRVVRVCRLYLDNLWTTASLVPVRSLNNGNLNGLTITVGTRQLCSIECQMFSNAFCKWFRQV